MAEKDPVAILRDHALPNNCAYFEEVRAVLARLDAAEEVCREVERRGWHPDLNLDSFTAWKELAQPKPEHLPSSPFCYGDGDWRITCGCKMQLTHFAAPGDVMLAWAKHYAEATRG